MAAITAYTAILVNYNLLCAATLYQFKRVRRADFYAISATDTDIVVYLRQRALGRY